MQGIGDSQREVPAQQIETKAQVGSGRDAAVRHGVALAEDLFGTGPSW